MNTKCTYFFALLFGVIGLTAVSGSVSAETTATTQAVSLFVDNDGDRPMSCNSTNLTNCYCNDAVDNDCGLRQAIETANYLQSNITIRFLDAYLIDLTEILPAITGYNISVSGQVSGSERV